MKNDHVSTYTSFLKDRDLEDIDKITLDQLIDIFRIYEVNKMVRKLY